MLVCIEATIAGTSKHLLVSNDGIAWCEDPPDEALLLGFEETPPKRSFATLAALTHKSIDLEPSSNIVSMMRELVPDDAWPPPWAKCLTRDQHKAFIQKLTSDVLATMAVAPLSYFQGVWQRTSSVLDSLQRARVENADIAMLSAKFPSALPALNSFAAEGDGYARSVVYDRFATRTGRLVIVDGPQAATLYKPHRRIVRSRYGDAGNVVYLDVSALEVRVLFQRLGLPAPCYLYEELNSQLFSNVLSRDVVKGAVIRAIYGMHPSKLQTLLEEAGPAAHDFATVLSKHCDSRSLLNELKAQYVREQIVTNLYGRPLKIEEPSDHIFINTFAQATGVDASLLCFANVLERLSGQECVPLFIIHDALVLDAHESAMTTLKSIDTVQIEGFKESFPLKLSLLDRKSVV